MSQNRVFDDFARLVTDASEMAQGVRREAETAMKSQLERLLTTMDVVTREEFEAVKQMAAKARDVVWSLPDEDVPDDVVAAAVVEDAVEDAGVPAAPVAVSTPAPPPPPPPW